MKPAAFLLFRIFPHRITDIGKPRRIMILFKAMVTLPDMLPVRGDLQRLLLQYR